MPRCRSAPSASYDVAGRAGRPVTQIAGWPEISHAKARSSGKMTEKPTFSRLLSASHCYDKPQRKRSDGMTKKHLPPATKFGPGGTAQTKTLDAAAPRIVIQPPQTRYGSPPTAQAKAAPPTSESPNFLSFSPHGASLQTKTISDPRWPTAQRSQNSGRPISHLSGAGKGAVGTIQMMQRNMMEQEHNFMLVPQDGSLYENHVRDRLKHFVSVMIKLCIYYFWAKNQGVKKNMSQMVSETAEVQVSSGVYTQSMKIDAAHLMNTSLRPDYMKSGLTLSPKQEYAINELHRISGATTPQLKANNVGPDKVIDRCMSDFRHQVEVYFSTAVPDSGTLIGLLADLCENRLMIKHAEKTKGGKIPSGDYAGAIKGIAEARKTTWEIDEDCRLWAAEYDFV